ncbi:hypothetical protein [Klebsiella aerogenes]|nr:hypothetical protein [Klebsiella aerogenes]
MKNPPQTVPPRNPTPGKAVKAHAGMMQFALEVFLREYRKALKQKADM